MASITEAPPAHWDEEELRQLRADYPELAATSGDAVTKYNPTPGKGQGLLDGVIARRVQARMMAPARCCLLLQGPGGPATSPSLPTTTPSTASRRNTCP